MGLSTLQENYHANVGVYYTVKRKHHPTKGLWARFDRYYKSGLFCDVSLYCRNSDVPPDFVASGYGDYVKVKCHSLVLATFSEQLGNLLKWCTSAADNVASADGGGNGDAYVLVLPDTPASELVKFLDQVYESLALMDEDTKQGMSLETTAQLMDLFGLKPDNIDLIDVVEPFYPTTLITQASGNVQEAAGAESDEDEAIEEEQQPEVFEPEETQVMEHALSTAPHIKVVLAKLDDEGAQIKENVEDKPKPAERPKPLSRKKVKPHPVVVPKPVMSKLMADGGVTYVSYDPPAVSDVQTVAVTPRPSQQQRQLTEEKENYMDGVEPPQIVVVDRKRSHEEAFAKPMAVVAKKSRPAYTGAKRGRKPGRGGRRGGGRGGGSRKRAVHDDGSRSYDESAKKTLMTKFQKTSVLHFDTVESPHDVEYQESMLEAIRKSEGKVRLVSADYDQNQIFTCTECEMTQEEPGVNKYLAHFLSCHKEKKPRITCQSCGKEQLMFMNFISHSFKHKVYDFAHQGMVALLGLGSVEGKNVACTLGCSDPEWDDGNTIFNFFKMLELTYKFTTEQLYDYFMLENNPKGATKRGRYGAQKSSASDQRIFISKQNYAGVPVEQQRDALRKFHEENPNMFMPADEPNHTIIPQVPAMMHQTYGDFELVSGLSFDQILDVAVVYQNLHTRQLETMSTVRMTFHGAPITALRIRNELPMKMATVLNKMLRCPDGSLQTLKSVAGNVFATYFQAYEQIYPDVIALKELVDYKVCPECDKVFPSSNYVQVLMYKDHLRGHTASVPKLITPDCNCKIDLTDLQKRKEHMISTHGIDISTNPNVECDCKMTYTHVQPMLDHMRDIHGQELLHFPCTVTGCTAVYLQKFELDDHIKKGRHSIRKTCPKCGIISQSMEQHMTMRHKEYACGNCGKVVEGKSAHKIHVRNCQTGCWKCPLCKKVFETEEYLQAHKAEVHDDNKPKVAFCSFCNKGFTKPEFMRTHERKVHKRPSLIAKRGEGVKQRRA